MNYAELLQAARGQMGPCRACPVCNGRACGGNIPGPGAKGSGTVANRNFDAWRNVRLNMDTRILPPIPACSCLGVHLNTHFLLGRWAR